MPIKPYQCRDCFYKFDEFDAINCSLCPDEYNVGCPKCGNDDIIHVGDQQEKIREFESELNIGPVAASQKLDTPYHTYKDWKSGRRKMPGCAYTAINLWLSIQES